jgi:hypothetical protein
MQLSVNTSARTSTARLANVVPSPILKGRFGYARIYEHREERGWTSECRCAISAVFPLAILERCVSAHGLLAVLAVQTVLCAAAQTKRFVSPRADLDDSC